MDLLQTGLVSPHPSYYLLCLAQTNSLLVCLFFGGGVIFSPTAKQDPVITCVCVCGWRDEGWRGDMQSELICLGRRKTRGTQKTAGMKSGLVLEMERKRKERERLKIVSDVRGRRSRRRRPGSLREIVRKRWQLWTEDGKL